MNRRSFIRKLGFGATGMVFGTVPWQLMGSEDFITISILHTNDLHSHVEPFEGTNSRFSGKGGLARISALVQHYRKKNPGALLFDAGDMFQGTPYFNYFKGELILKLMSAAGYDAGTLGNHEFDNGLAGLLEPLPNAQFPLICSNYDFSDTILAGKFPRWRIFKRSGLKIGVYGLGIDFDGLVSASSIGETIYNNPLSVALEMEKFLKMDKGCDLVVCLSHLGLRYRNNKVSDMVIASETSMTDLILGGHTHTFLEEPLELKNKDGKQVIVNQAWWGGLVVGQFEFVFERTNNRKRTIFANKLL